MNFEEASKKIEFETTGLFYQWKARNGITPTFSWFSILGIFEWGLVGPNPTGKIWERQYWKKTKVINISNFKMKSQ